MAPAAAAAVAAVRSQAAAAVGWSLLVAAAATAAVVRERQAAAVVDSVLCCWEAAAAAVAVIAAGAEHLGVQLQCLRVLAAVVMLLQAGLLLQVSPSAEKAVKLQNRRLRAVVVAAAELCL